MTLQTGGNHRQGRVDHGKKFWKAVSTSFRHWHGRSTPLQAHLHESGTLTLSHCVRATACKVPKPDSLRCQAQRSHASEGGSNGRVQWAPRHASAAYSPSPSQLLNSTINRCSTVVGLNVILQQDHSSLDAVHLCMMMTKLLSFVPRKHDQPNVQTTSPNARTSADSSQTQVEVIHHLATDITAAALKFYNRLTPRHCSTLLSGLSHCISPLLPPPTHLIQTLTRTAVERVASASVHDIVQLLHAVTNLKSLPTLPQLTVLLVQLLQHAQLQREEPGPRVGPQDVSMTLWSLATMQQHPGSIWLDSFLLCCARQLPEYRPQALANSMWAVATLSHQPPASWMEGALTAAHAQLPSYPPQELSTLLWALATLRYVPPPEFLVDAWQQLHDRCTSLNPQDVSNALWACSQFGHRPSAPVLAVLAAHATSQVHSYSPQALCNVLEAFRRLKVSTPGQMLSAALTAAATSSSTLSGRDIASLLNSLAGTCLPNEARDISDAFLPTSLDVTALTSGDSRLLQKFLSSCCSRPSSDFSAHDLVLVGQAVAGLQQSFQPDERWVQWWLVSTLPKMRSSRGRALSRLCNTAASLHASPPAAWLGACMQAVAHRMQELQPADLVSLCGALKSMSHPSPLALMHQASCGVEDLDNQRFMQQQQQTAVQQVVRIALPDTMMSQLRLRVAQRASDYSVRQLSSVVRSMAEVEAAVRVTDHSDSLRRQLQRWRPSSTATNTGVLVRPKAVKRKVWRLKRKNRYRAMPGGVAGRLAGSGIGRQVLRYAHSGIMEQRQADLADAMAGISQNGQQRGLRGSPSRFLLASRFAPAEPAATGAFSQINTTQTSSAQLLLGRTGPHSLSLQQPMEQDQHSQAGQQHGRLHSTHYVSQVLADDVRGRHIRNHEVSDEDLREELTVWYGIACLLSLSTWASRKKLGQLCSLRGYDAIPQLPAAQAQGRLVSPNLPALRLGA